MWFLIFCFKTAQNTCKRSAFALKTQITHVGFGFLLWNKKILMYNFLFYGWNTRIYIKFLIQRINKVMLHAW